MNLQGCHVNMISKATHPSTAWWSASPTNRSSFRLPTLVCKAISFSLLPLQKSCQDTASTTVLRTGVRVREIKGALECNPIPEHYLQHTQPAFSAHVALLRSSVSLISTRERLNQVASSSSPKLWMRRMLPGHSKPSLTLVSSVPPPAPVYLVL